MNTANLTIQQVLNGALSLNGNDKKYIITVEGNKIITSVKWMDATFFAPSLVTNEMREFKFVATLNNDNTWSELDETETVQKTAGLGGVAMSKSTFKGKTIRYSKTIAFGQKNGDGKLGIVECTFSTQEYKKPVSEYLTACGYRKAKKGFFATLFGR